MAKYIKGVPRLTIEMEYQVLPDEVRVYTDSDHAGDVWTRRSSGGAQMFGQACVQTWSVLQQSIALSSGEAEYYSCGLAAAHGIETQHMLE